MRHILAAAAVVGLSAGAAQAAVYQYFVTMELESLTVDNLQGLSSGPPSQIEGVECEPTGQPDITHDCYGSPNFADIQFDTTILREWTTPTILGTFTLGGDYNFVGGQPSGPSPECLGSALICQHLSGPITNRIGLSDSFSVFTGNGISYDFRMTGEGLTYRDDGGVEFTLGNTHYFNSGGLLIADYTTTSLTITEIAPIPLPASLPLLGVGIAAAGWVARRRRS